MPHGSGSLNLPGNVQNLSDNSPAPAQDDWFGWSHKAFQSLGSLWGKARHILLHKPVHCVRTCASLLVIAGLLLADPLLRVFLPFLLPLCT